MRGGEIDDAPCRHGQHRGDDYVVSDGAGDERHHRPGDGRALRTEIHEHRPAHAESAVDEDAEVAELLGDLVEEDGNVVDRPRTGLTR